MRLIAVDGEPTVARKGIADGLVRRFRDQRVPVLSTTDPDGSGPLQAELKLLLKKSKSETVDAKSLGTMAELNLFLAARSALVEKRLLPWTEKNPRGVIVAERWDLSTHVFQIAQARTSGTEASKRALEKALRDAYALWSTSPLFRPEARVLVAESPAFQGELYRLYHEEHKKHPVAFTTRPGEESEEFLFQCCRQIFFPTHI